MYVKKVEVAGEIRTERRYHTGRYGKRGIRREPHTKPTPEQMQRQNERTAIHKLWLLLNANFVPGDYLLTLTYRPEQRPENAEDYKSQMAQFLRRCRTLYRRAGKEFRYIWVFESESSAPHFHLVCNYHDLQAIQALWPHGMVRPTLLYAEGNFKGLAEYLVKETRRTFSRPGAVSRKRYNPSKNLIQPTVTVEPMTGGSWQKTPRIPKGYRLLGEVETGEDAITGMPYQYIELLRIPPIADSAANRHPPQINRKC